jgi:hypothetical protein
LSGWIIGHSFTTALCAVHKCAKAQHDEQSKLLIV